MARLGQPLHELVHVHQPVTTVTAIAALRGSGGYADFCIEHITAASDRWWSDAACEDALTH